MAKLISLFKYSGTLDGITSVHPINSEPYLKKKGGLSKERIKTDPKLNRIRENNKEFGMMAAASKAIRDPFNELRHSVRVQYLTPRLTHYLTKIKNLDHTSARGNRSVQVGLESEVGKNILLGFNFNAKKTLQAVLQRSFELDINTGTITILSLMPALHLLGGMGATTVELQSYWAKIDFETGQSKLSKSNAVNLNVKSKPVDVFLMHDQALAGVGINIFVLSIVFYQTVNNVDYMLKDGSYNVADIVGVF